MPNNQAPAIHNKGIYIVDKDQGDLAAVIASYLYEEGWYYPCFAFPNVAAPDSEENDVEDDAFMSRMIGKEAAVLINNALLRMGGCDYIVLCGLTEYQKSYLKIPRNAKVIEINSIDEVHNQMSAMGIPERDELRCKRSEIMKGACVAQKTRRRIVLDDDAPTLPEHPKNKGGIVVVENNADVATVVALNYANAVGANLLVVEPLAEGESREIQKEIQEWQENNDYSSFQKVKDRIAYRVGNVPFGEFEYATFFTNGLPYSLGIKNIIPCSYVHLLLRPDFFVLNNILYEYIDPFGSAVVFSPSFFEGEEETGWLLEFLAEQSYYLRDLIAGSANVRSLGYHAEFFPYDLLHICSHGGEVEGYAVEERFVDRDGIEHLVEYDEVVGFSPLPQAELVEVHRKTIFHKFDGFQWKSDELRKQRIPSYVFEDMRKALYHQEGPNETAKRKRKGRIPTSCAIACSDSIHQGMFRTLAAHSSPLVFNNTCWSWYEVAHFFIAGGARGYIGTLWDIKNEVAVQGSKTFYENLSGSTILNAIHSANLATKGTSSEDIYVYWGLHFSTLPAPTDPRTGRVNVARELVESFGRYRNSLAKTTSVDLRQNIVNVMAALLDDLERNFIEDVRRLREDFESGTSRQERDTTRQVGGYASLDLPKEYRAAGPGQARPADR